MRQFREGFAYLFGRVLHGVDPRVRTFVVRAPSLAIHVHLVDPLSAISTIIQRYGLIFKFREKAITKFFSLKTM